MKVTIFEKYYAQFLLLILAFTFFTRAYRLHIPEKYVFDEVYHAVTAKLMVDGDPRAYEWHNPPPEPNTAVDWLHPPYAKLTQAFSMSLFGKNTFGWRFSSVIFGCLVVLVTAKIAEELFDNKRLSLVAAFLISLDGLLFAMSRIAMNDVHVTFFILLSIWQYILYTKENRKLKKALLFSSIAAGFAVGTKWSGAFAIGYIGINELIYTLKTFFSVKKKDMFRKVNLIFFKQQVLLMFVTCLIIPAILYLGSYSQMFLLGKDFNHLIEMHKNTWWYQTNLDASHPAQSQPIQWFLNTKPVWIAASYTSSEQRADIYAVGNTALFWFANIATFATMITLVMTKVSKKVKLKKSERNMLGMLLFAYFIVWLPWQLSPRIMFFYHYLPAVPLMTINLTYWLFKIWNIRKIRLLSILVVFLIFANFVAWYPHLTLLPVSKTLKDNLYFYFDFWKQA